MNLDIFNLSIKQLNGEKLTDSDVKRINRWNLKYELVRYLIREKNPKLLNFQFTPGEDFEDTPTIDIVNSLIKLSEDLQSGKVKPEPIRFNDLHNPPQTGIEKRRL